MRVVLGVFFILHGLVHLLYSGQSLRYFELQKGMTWPDESWLFSKISGNRNTEKTGGIICIIAAACFICGGILFLFSVDLWNRIILFSSLFSTFVYLILWDGKIRQLDNKGGVGILINLVILLLMEVIKWPEILTI